MAKGFGIFEIPIEVILAILIVAVVLALFPSIAEGILGQSNSGFNSLTEGILRIFGG